MVKDSGQDQGSLGASLGDRVDWSQPNTALLTEDQIEDYFAKAIGVDGRSRIRDLSKQGRARELVLWDQGEAILQDQQTARYWNKVRSGQVQYGLHWFYNWFTEHGDDFFERGIGARLKKVASETVMDVLETISPVFKFIAEVKDLADKKRIEKVPNEPMHKLFAWTVVGTHKNEFKKLSPEEQRDVMEKLYHVGKVIERGTKMKYGEQTPNIVFAAMTMKSAHDFAKNITLRSDVAGGLTENFVHQVDINYRETAYKPDPTTRSIRHFLSEWGLAPKPKINREESFLSRVTGGGKLMRPEGQNWEMN